MSEKDSETGKSKRVLTFSEGTSTRTSGSKDSHASDASTRSFKEQLFATRRASRRRVTMRLDVPQKTSETNESNSKQRKGNLLLSNYVDASWYKRFINMLPENERIMYQPKAEIEKRQEDIAMQFMYGDNPPEPHNDTDEKNIRRQAVLRYNYEKKKQMGEVQPEAKENKRMPILKERVPSYYKIIEKQTDTWFEQAAKEDAWDRIREERRRRGFNMKTSNWRIFKRLYIKRKVAKMIEEHRINDLIRRFKKSVTTVRCCMRFFKLLLEFQGQRVYFREKLDELLSDRISTISSKSVFNPLKYKRESGTIFSEHVKYILTKTWEERTEEEIDEVVLGLQVLKCFSEYPPPTQRLIATVAWLITVEDKRVLIRQGQIAQAAYILLSGKVSKTVFVGDNKFRLSHTWARDSIIGEEALLDPESERGFSATTCCTCDILSINQKQLHDCTMVPTKPHSLASDHIIFLSQMPFIANVNKMALVEEAEDNISLAYFRKGQVMTRSLRDSVWIYLIRTGSCRVMEYASADEKKRSSNSKFAYVDSEPIEPDCLILEDQMTELEVTSNISYDGSDYVNALIDKEMAVMRTRPGQIKRSGKTTPIDPLDQEIEDIIKKTEEVDRYIRSKRKITSFVSRSPNKEQLKGDATKPEQPKAEETKPADQSKAEGTKPDQPKEETANPEQSPIEAAKPKLLKFESQNDSDSSDEEDEVRRKAYNDMKRRRTISFKGSFGYSNSDSKKQVVYRSRKLTIKMTDSSIESTYFQNLMDPPLADSYDRQKSLENEDIEEKRTFQKAKKDKICTKKWRYRNSLEKGNQMGFEYVDLDDGTYREPTSDFGLISDGCEVVLVRKMFIVEQINSVKINLDPSGVVSSRLTTSSGISSISSKIHNT